MLTRILAKELGPAVRREMRLRRGDYQPGYPPSGRRTLFAAPLKRTVRPKRLRMREVFIGGVFVTGHVWCGWGTDVVEGKVFSS